MNLLEQAWYKKHWWCALLLPFSTLFYLVSSVRRLLFRTGVLKTERLPVPVLIVGNITVGGTGKTPFTIWLCDYLRERGYTPGIISRGYGGKVKAPRLVTELDSPALVGDEPLLLAQRSGCPIVVSPDRVAAGRFLLEKRPQVDIIISDDGLQHYRLARDLEIVLLDGQRGLGNGWLLPAGPLRELPKRLASVDLVIANSGSSVLAAGEIKLSSAAASPLLPDAEPLTPDTEIQLVAGIGNPLRFKASAEQAGFKIKHCHFWPDHHPFQADDFNMVSGPILMTEKDAVKCRKFARPDWYYLPVQAEPDAAVVARLNALLNTLGIRYGTQSGID
ncbi:tetraacyldisaccharide 4'-kinase [Alishewanella sp. BS5-314]|uniref:tetraacyldisaccharide 4'-kinase n=1 Tax=Alishewanella sp. BS5-314 TaxID=2755587 RepID=UPI0021BA3BE9|nr:tetraacyldisaccharide 4'-kinase [Alishewanella sp. BS5-314]MCT8126244.1 tetraacyldisaccharide 4'-kinase [Alishewanella sp. BS5-314]